MGRRVRYNVRSGCASVWETCWLGVAYFLPHTLYLDSRHNLHGTAMWIEEWPTLLHQLICAGGTCAPRKGMAARRRQFSLLGVALTPCQTPCSNGIVRRRRAAQTRRGDLRAKEQFRSKVMRGIRHRKAYADSCFRVARGRRASQGERGRRRNE